MMDLEFHQHKDVYVSLISSSSLTKVTVSMYSYLQSNKSCCGENIR